MANQKDSEIPDDTNMTPGDEDKKQEDKQAQASKEQKAEQKKPAPSPADSEKKKKGGGWGGIIALGILIAVAGNSALALHPMFRGSYDHNLILQYFFLPVGAVIMLLGLIVFIVSLMTKKAKALSAGRAGLVLGLCLLSMWISLPIGNHLLEREIEEAKAFCMSLIEEGIVAPNARGIYPNSIAGELEDKELPRLLPERFYSGAGDRFMFYIEDPRDDTIQHIYRSEQDRWTP